jgi:hypothetical protein
MLDFAVLGFVHFPWILLTFFVLVGLATRYLVFAGFVSRGVFHVFVLLLASFRWTSVVVVGFLVVGFVLGSVAMAAKVVVGVVVAFVVLAHLAVSMYLGEK